MSKLSGTVIGKDDLIDFLDKCSDLSFEIKTLKSLSDKGFKCDHSGTYDDPATKKPRQFDIRATLNDHRSFLRLAVECKNVRDNFPLLISCMPRRREEAFHEIVFSVTSRKYVLGNRPNPIVPALLPVSRSIRLTHDRTFYKFGEPVGKACDQVGKNPNGEITANDAGIYEKWSQSLSSADDLVLESCYDGSYRTKDVALSLVFPVLVVPNGRLWMTSFDEHGGRTADPFQIDRCSYFVNRDYYHRSVSGGDRLTLSHLEIVTTNGLVKFIDEVTHKLTWNYRTFPWEDIDELVPDVQRL
jgi:hypothetical protein